jgi:glucose/arabinose dehydrogenase
MSYWFPHNLKIRIATSAVLKIILCATFVLTNGIAAWAKPLVRVANTTLQMPQMPAAYGYQFTNLFPQLKFNNPIYIVAPPGETNRLFIVERAGRIIAITNLAAPDRTVFLDITSKVRTTGDGGVMTMTFHPGFATNGYFYVYYTGTNTTAVPGGTNSFHDILSRFTVSSTNQNFSDTDTEEVLIRQYDRSPDHNGADLHFAADGYLYLTLGDEGSPRAVGYDYWGNSQLIDKNFFSGMLRLDVDQRPENLAPNPHPASVPGTYKIPADNPFVGATSFNGLPVDPNKVRTEFWAVGLRNPFRFTIDGVTGRIFVADVGQSTHEEVDVITKGGNYGWIFREGAHPTDVTKYHHDIPAGFTNYIDPIFEYGEGVTGTNLGQCIIGGFVYRGNLISQLNGYYVFGDNIASRVWAFKYDGTNVSNYQLLATTFPKNTLVAFGADPRNGDVLAANIVNGLIYRLVYDTNNVSGTPLPPTLADTGAFADLAALAPNPGIVSYDINVPFWSDNAIKSRWISVPNTNLTIGFSATNNWMFPTGTVWIKHFNLELTNGVPSSAKRIETRFIVKNSEGVYGVTYRWGDSTTNASLVPEAGMDENFVIHDRDGTILRTQTWHYPARTECLSCHTAVAGFALGVNTPQMNRKHDYAGTTANEIQAFSDAGYFSNKVARVSSMLALASATNKSASVEFRVRSYLAANCVQCHQPGGVALQQASWDARITTPLSAAGIVDGLLVKNFGDTNNRVVKFGSLSRLRHEHKSYAATRHVPRQHAGRAASIRLDFARRKIPAMKFCGCKK